MVSIDLENYPLVICNIAIENGHRNSGFTHEKWWIFPSFFVNVYQRVLNITKSKLFSN